MSGFNQVAQTEDPRTCLFASHIDQAQHMTGKLEHLTTQLRKAIDMISGPQVMEKTDPHVKAVTPISMTVGMAWDELCQAADALERQIDRLY